MIWKASPISSAARAMCSRSSTEAPAMVAPITILPRKSAEVLRLIIRR